MGPLEHNSRSGTHSWYCDDERQSSSKRHLDTSHSLRPKHKPLIPYLEDFRILILHPSTEFEAEIYCAIEHVSFGSHPPYEALSYRWSDDEGVNTITLDGSVSTVSNTLAAALRQLRKPNEARAIWIDALCIDQQNLAERSSQVRLMREIYSSCSADLVWLGEANEGKERAFAIAAKLERTGIEAIRRKVRDTLVREYAEDAYKILSRDDWRTLLNAFARLSIWRRVWIMQELACAPKVVLVMGNSLLDWDIISRFLVSDNYPDASHGPFHRYSYEANINLTFADVQAIEHQRSIVRDSRAGYKSKLLDVLARFRMTRATDPRDKIYGLLGLASDTMGVIPDYTKPLHQVYTDFFRTYVDTTQNLDLLCQDPWGIRCGPVKDLELPSWCPDFSNAKSSSRGSYLIFALRSIFRAGSDKCRSPCKITDQASLYLDGVSLGRLARIKYRWYDRDIPPCQGFAALSMPEELKGSAVAGPDLRYPPNGEEAFQAYWRTLLIDCKRYPTVRLDSDDMQACKTIFDSWLKVPHGYLDLGLGLRDTGAAVMTELMFVITDTGIYCMVPHHAEVGDEVVIFPGGKVPLVVRAEEHVNPTSKDGSCHAVIGTAYAHGFMDGEAAMVVEGKRLNESSFVIV